MTHDPTDPVGRLLFKVLAMMAEFESDLNWTPASCTQAALAELVGGGRSTVYRTIERMRAQASRTRAAIHTSRPTSGLNQDPLAGPLTRPHSLGVPLPSLPCMPRRY